MSRLTQRTQIPNKVLPNGCFGPYGCMSVVSKLDPHLADTIYQTLSLIPNIAEYYSLIDKQNLHISAYKKAIVQQIDHINQAWEDTVSEHTSQCDSFSNQLALCPKVGVTITSVSSLDPHLSKVQ